MHITSQIKIRQRILSTLVILAIFMLNLGTVTAASIEDADAHGIAFETYLDHPSDDGSIHPGHFDKCPLMKHLTLPLDGIAILLSYNMERIIVPDTKIVVGLSSQPLFRPPIS